MKSILFLVILIGLSEVMSAQYVYTIRADSVKLTNCDSSELIIENHTQGVPGFLFNTGNGRTVFKRGVSKISGGLYLIGADTLNLGVNAWVQGGNSFGATGFLGTLDNNHLDFITNDTQRVRLSKAGNLLIGDTADNGYKLHVKGGLFQDGGIFNKNYYTDVSSSSMKIGSGYELFGVSHSAGGYSLYLSGGLNGDFSSGWDMAFGTSTNRIMTIDHQSVNTNQPLKVNAGLVLPEQSSYMSSPYVGFQYASSNLWNWAVVNSSNVPNLVVRSNGNVVVGSTLDNGDKFQVRGNSAMIGPLNTGARLLMGDSITNNAFGIRSYGDTSNGGNNHYATIGLNLQEPYAQYNTSKQGGGIYFDDREGVQPIRFMVRPAGVSYIAAPAGGVTSTGNFLMGTVTDNGKKLQVNGDIFGGDLYLNNGGILISGNAGSRIMNAYEGIRIYNSTSTGDYFSCYTGQTGIGSSGAINFRANGSVNPGIYVSTVSSGPSSTTLTFGNARNDGIKSAIINTADFDATLLGGSTGVNLFMYPGKETYSNNQANTIMAYDGTNQRGNILVGTTSDNGSKLQVNGSSYFTGTVRFAGLTSDNTQTRVLVSDANGNLYYRDASTLASNGILNADLANGNVVLHSLAINGTISAQRMKLSQAGWPDYVFARNYDLPKLNEIEEYIQRNGHLPGIPSAADVEKKGVDVGDHQAALLKKIEELTLYVINQEKKLKTQEQQISELQQQNKDLNDLKKEMTELRKLIEK
ncbi:MAG TPA: hypothetical protein VNS58_05145 [Puia sp.]|nr:hypothetical protein [Puia sp.]